MKYANEIEKEVKNTAYEEIFIEIVKNAKNDKLKKKLEEISLNGALTKKQKEEIYNCVLDYNKKISESFVNKIEDIYNKGVKDGNLQSYLSNISINFLSGFIYFYLCRNNNIFYRFGPLKKDTLFTVEHLSDNLVFEPLFLEFGFLFYELVCYL